MNTIEMSRKDFAKKILEKVESRLIKEGYAVNEDIDDGEGYAGESPKSWEKYVKEVLGQSDYVQKINKEVEYKSIEGKTCNITVREGSEYYDKLEKVSSAKAKNYPEVWREMVSFVREIIEKTGKPKLYELIRIRPKGEHTSGRTSSTIRVNWVDIDAFNVIGFDSFYNKVCREIVDYPKGKARGIYSEPISFVEHSRIGDATYNGELTVEWNFEPMTYTMFGKYILKNVYDIDEGPEFAFDIAIPKISHPVDDSIKRNLNDERPRVEDKLFAQAVNNKSIWFDVYINMMDHVKMELERKKITDVKALSEVTAEEIINNVNAATI